MKKIFTLFATAVMAMSAYAQEKEWNVSNWDNASYTENKTIDGFTIYATSKGKVDIDDNNKTVDGVKYTKRVKTGGAGSSSNGELSRVFSFDISGSGTVSFIATSSNSSDTRTVGIAFGEFIAFPAEGAANPDGLKTESVEPGNPQVKTVSYEGAATTVYIYSQSGGINFYDFKFTPAAATEEPEPAEGEVFEVAGSWPQGDFGTVTTPFAIDFTTKTITLDNFLGGGVNLICKYIDADANIPVGVDKKYYITPESGATENGTDIWDLDGFKDKSVEFKKDGINTIKLNSPKFYSSYYSNINIETGNKYSIVLYLSGESYNTWDADNNSWSADQTFGFFELRITVPGPSQSGIEDIVVDEFDENAPVEYYNLQGIRVNEPVKGQVVIRRQGSKAIKMVVR